MGALDAISTEARAILFEALMNVAWADREFVEEELQAARGAAMGLGLVLPWDRDLTSPSREPIAPEDLRTDALNKKDRKLVYLCSAWMAFADNVEDPDETAILKRLQTQLEISDQLASDLKKRAKEIRAAKPERSSWWKAFDQLVVNAAKALSDD